ncbi:MAG TPA: hypothetical protein VK436_04485 [Methanocella sp.]|nr:hypothetical protein [Methanocella sp.]
MEMDKLEQENAAATVFSYLIRGLSNGNTNMIKTELITKMSPIKELYSLSDDIFPLYIDRCMEMKKFLKMQDALEAFGAAIDAGRLSTSEERIIMTWVSEVMRQNKTTGNVKTKRR